MALSGAVKGITVKIDGDTTGLGKAFNRVKKQGIQLNKELKEINKALKMDPKNVNLLAKKQETLAKAVQNATEKVKALEAAQGQVEAMYKAGEIDGGAYLEFQNELNAARANLQRLTEEQKNFGSVTSSVMESVGQSVEAVGDKIIKAGKKVGEVSKSIEDVGKKLTKTVTAPIVGVGVAATKMAWDFEDGMAKVSTVVDTSRIDMADLQQQIMDLSNASGVAPTEIAENVYNAISAGQLPENAVSFYAKSHDLARAGFAEEAQALDLLTTIMNAYGLESSEAVKVSDSLIRTQNEGKVTVGQLASSMGKVIPTAKANNVALDQLNASYAIMTKNGVAPAESTTYLNSMLNELGKTGSKSANILKKETGQSFDELMASGMSLGDVLGVVADGADKQNLKFSDMFGSSEAAKAGLILLGNTEADIDQGLENTTAGASEFNEMLGKISSDAPTTADALEKLNTQNYRNKVAFNELKNAGLELGGVIAEMVAPYIGQLSDKIHTAAEKFHNMDDKTKKTIVTVAGIAAAVGPGLIAIGKIGQGVSTVMKVGGSLIKGVGKGISLAGKMGTGLGKLRGLFLALPGPIKVVIAVIAGIAAVAGVFTLLYNRCEWFRNGVDKLWGGLKAGAAAGLEALKTTASEKLNNIKSAYEEHGGGVKGVMAAAWEGLKATQTFGLSFIDNLTGGKLTEIKDKFLTTPVGKAWTTTMDGVKRAGRLGMETLHNTTVEKLDRIQTAYQENGGGVRGIVSATMTGIGEIQTFGLDYVNNLTGGKLSAVRDHFATKMEAARGKVSTALGSIRESFSSKLSEAHSTVTSIMDNIKGAFSEKIEAAHQAVSNAVEKIKGAFNFSWSLPHLNLPRVSVSGGVAPYGIGGKGSLPQFSVDWYAQGGVLNKAQIFGALGDKLLGGGEAGPEAVLPLRSFYDNLGKLLDARLGPQGGGGGNFYQYNTYNSPKDLSPGESARLTRNETRKLLARAKLA